MIAFRRSIDRGHSNHAWIDSYHTFSFAEYSDPEQSGYRVLKVLNEDRIKPGEGFATHAHSDMEIVTYVLEGAIEHKDDLGNTLVLRSGDVQRMTAGTGISHSEYNASQDEEVHVLQVWIMPAQNGLPPSYEQRQFLSQDSEARMILLVSPDGSDASLTINQDVHIYMVVLNAGEVVRHTVPSGRHAYMHVARGAVTVNQQALQSGDGARIHDEEELLLTSPTRGEALLFDLP
jgi:hypothetical protein